MKQNEDERIKKHLKEQEELLLPSLNAKPVQNNEPYEHHSKTLPVTQGVESRLQDIENLIRGMQPIGEQQQPQPQHESVDGKKVHWADFNNGFPKSYMQKMGHVPGTGLGKKGDGIVSPVKHGHTSVPPLNTHSKKPSVLIAGTSMIGGLNQKTMSRKFHVKVRPHPGAKIKAMKHHLLAHMVEAKPDHLILQVGTNDAADKNISSDSIFESILDLKASAESTVPGIKVHISCPMVRTDDTRANAKLIQVKNKLVQAKEKDELSIILNDNITAEKHLSEKGLHLSSYGTKVLATNMIQFIRQL